MSTGPTINKGNSKQDYQTPLDFMGAVKQRYGKLSFDLAADKANTQCELFYSQEENSLIQPWHLLTGILWLNPPFDNIGHWAKKCHEESQKGVQILFLVPNSTGANWFRDYVHNKAYVTMLNGRLTFVGCKDPYPKDMVLIHYGAYYGAGYGIWDWRNEYHNQ